MNLNRYRRQSVEDAHDAVTVLLAVLLMIGGACYALS